MLLLNKDIFDTMKLLPQHSVNLIVSDLPYGTTGNKWDKLIPLEQIWTEFNRIIVPGGNMIFTASQPFTSKLIVSNLKQFRYENIWVKSLGSGQLNINKMPLKKHESILVFIADGGEGRVYNEELELGKPYTIDRHIKDTNCYGDQRAVRIDNNGTRRATSIWKIPNPRIKGGHPTEKPVELLRKIIRIYSNYNDIVFDGTFGGGSTAIAAKEEGRRFIGSEIDATYFNKFILN
jgi:DNA modification methylase